MTKELSWYEKYIMNFNNEGTCNNCLKDHVKVNAENTCQDCYIKECEIAEWEY